MHICVINALKKTSNAKAKKKPIKCLLNFTISLFIFKNKTNKTKAKKKLIKYFTFSPILLKNKSEIINGKIINNKKLNILIKNL